MVHTAKGKQAARRERRTGTKHLEGCDWRLFRITACDLQYLKTAYKSVAFYEVMTVPKLSTNVHESLNLR